MTNHFSTSIFSSVPASRVSSPARRFCSSALLAIMTLQGLVGCGASTDDGSPLGSDSAANEAAQAAEQLRISTEIEGTRYSAELTYRDNAIFGTRTVVYADGQVQTEEVNIQLDANAMPNALDALTDAPLAAGLRVASAETTDFGTNYVLETDSGLTFNVETDGESEYFAGLAAGVVITAIAVCGAVAITSVIACAARDRCWSFTGNLSNVVAFCGGSCKKC